ncbi:MAG: hypothetical protein ACRCWS_02865 [Propionibacteriaceae bacterium]
MELSGVIVGLVAVVGLLYLVPLYLSTREVDEDDVEETPFTDSVRLVHDVRSDDPETLDLSTPYMRATVRYDVARQAARAARNRRRMMGLLLAVLVIVCGTTVAGLTSWSNVAQAGGVLGGYLVISRVATMLQNRRFDARLRRLELADEEPTVCFTLAANTHERDVEISAPIVFTGSLWDPVPVTAPTYVQQPLAPRTVRTIDLSAPEASPRRDPVLVPEETLESIQLPHAVGE